MASPRGHQLCQGQGQSFVKRIVEILIGKKVKGEEKSQSAGVEYRKVEREVNKGIPKDLQQNGNQ